MPLDQVIISLPEFKVLKVLLSEPIVLEVIFEGRVQCHHCQSTNLRKKDLFVRKVRHFCFGEKQSTLHIKSHKFKCLKCKKYFNQRFPGILPRKRATEPFRRDVFQKHHDGITQRTLSLRLKIGTATIERWYQDLVSLQARKYNAAHCPKVMGIDEHFFTRKKGYATTICDLTKHKVFDVTLGRSEKSLKPYLQKLPGKDNVKVILMDLSETYRSIAHQHFPKALVVADRFHVIRLVNHHFLNTWKQLDPKGRKSRGLTSLMRRHRRNLKPDQIPKLKKYFDEVPGLETIYEFKQELCELLIIKQRTKNQCKPLVYKFLSMIEQLKNSGFEPLKTLGETLQNWAAEIGRMWRFTKTNSITEGLHNKMEMLSRRAFGFRNFENYRLRVRVHCG
jgi:transposase